MVQQAYSKPLPVMQGYTAEFYNWCKQHELRFQRCTDCGRWRHIPWPLCSACHSFNWEWARSTGKAEVYTFTIVYQALHPAFEPDVPYVAAIVALEEGPRIVSWVTDVRPEDVKIGMPLQIWFDDVTPEVTLPKFRPA